MLHDAMTPRRRRPGRHPLPARPGPQRRRARGRRRHPRPPRPRRRRRSGRRGVHPRHRQARRGGREGRRRRSPPTGIAVTVWDVRCCAPLDADMLADAARHRAVVTCEDGVRDGGIGMAIEDRIGALDPATPVEVLGLPTSFLPHDGPARAAARPARPRRRRDRRRRPPVALLTACRRRSPARSSTSSMVAPGRTSGAGAAPTPRRSPSGPRSSATCRFWVAEHHNMATVASTSPPVLMAHLGRVDLVDPHRLGRRDAAEPRPARRRRAVRHARGAAPRAHRPRHRPGARAPTRRRRPRCGARPSLGAEDFPRDLLDLMGLLGDERVEHGRVVALPGDAGRDVAARRSCCSARAASRPRSPASSAWASRSPTTSTCRRRARGVRAVPRVVPAVAGARRAVHDRDRRRARRRRRRAGRAPRRAGPAGDPRHPHRTAACRCCRPTRRPCHPDLDVARSMPSNRIVGDGAERRRRG